MSVIGCKYFLFADHLVCEDCYSLYAIGSIVGLSWILELLVFLWFPLLTVRKSFVHSFLIHLICGLFISFSVELQFDSTSYSGTCYWLVWVAKGGNLPLFGHMIFASCLGLSGALLLLGPFPGTPVSLLLPTRRR